MKISIITSPFGDIPPFGFGAVERRWYQVAMEIVALGHDILLISKRPEQGVIEFEPANNFKVFHQKGFSRTGNLYKDLVLDLWYSWRCLRSLPRTDVLVMNTFWSPFLCAIFRSKFTVSVYNVARFPKGQFRHMTHIDRLACVSQSVLNALQQQSPRAAARAKVINNPVNTTVFYKIPKPLHKEFFGLLYTGRIHPEKGIDLLVAAWIELKTTYPKLMLSLMGPYKIADGGGGERYKAALDELAKPFSINWCAPVSDSNELCAKIAASDIYCYPSIAEEGETFGVAPLEAMATGTATIVSALECFQDFVVDGKNALVFNHRVKNPIPEIKSKLECLILDKKLRQNLAEAGAETAKKFSNKIIAEQYLQDFNDLLLMKQKHG